MKSTARFAALTLMLVTAPATRSALATRLDAFTIDEPYHIDAGVAYVTRGDYRLNPEQPPLVKLWAGAFVAPVYHLPPLRAMQGKMDERDFHETALFLGNDADAIQHRARLAMLAFHLLSLLALAFAVRRLFGDGIALGTLLFLAIDPTVAAHMPVVMTDLPVALWSTIAVLTAATALRSERLIHAGMAAVALGLALGAKHNGIVAALAVAVLALLWIRRRRQFAAFGIIAAGALLVLWAQYGFRYHESAGVAETFNEPLAIKVAALHTPLFRQVLKGVSASHLLPRAYVWGLADVLRAGVEGRAYPFTEFGRTFIGHTPWFYFLGAVAAKIPIGLLLLSLAGLVLAAWREAGTIAAAVAGGCFLLALMTSNSGYAGVRHALPLFPPLALFGGVAVAHALAHSGMPRRIVAALLILVACVEALPVLRPWEFYNALAGGTTRAYLRFDDEGADLGQRVSELASFYRSHIAPSRQPAYDVYGILDRDRERRHMKILTWSDTLGIPGTRFDGWFAIRAVAFASDTPWMDMGPFRRARPVARFGNLFIYHGSFDLPWVLSFNEFYRGEVLLHTSKTPDPAAIESLFTHAASLNPRAYPICIALGNIRARRGDRERAIEAFREAGRWIDRGDPLSAALTRHVARLQRETPQSVPELTNPWAE